jgi:hypothetical protein
VKVSRQALAEVLVYVQLVRPDLNGAMPREPAVTEAMINAAVEAAWPGPEIVYDDNFGSAEAMMRAALEAALAVQGIGSGPQEAPNREQIARTLAYEEWPLAEPDERQRWTDRHWMKWLRQADAVLALSRPQRRGGEA